MGLLTKDLNQEQLSNFTLYRVTNFSLVKGKTFVNPVAHPYPNYMGVPPSLG